MTQPNDNTYISITFPNISRIKAEEILEQCEELGAGFDISVDWGAPIGSDTPTPIADETQALIDKQTPTQ